MPLSSPLVLDTIFRNAESTSLLIVDRSGKIVDFNLGFQKLFGYSRETLVGKDIAILYTEDALTSKLPKNLDRKSTRLNSSHVRISYAVFCLKKKKIKQYTKII